MPACGGARSGVLNDDAYDGNIYACAGWLAPWPTPGGHWLRARVIVYTR